MCSHYQAIKERERYIRAFGVKPPAEPGKVDLWPGYMGSFIRRHPSADLGDESVPASEAISGMFGLGKRWATGYRSVLFTFACHSINVGMRSSLNFARGSSSAKRDHKITQ